MVSSTPAKAPNTVANLQKANDKLKAVIVIGLLLVIAFFGAQTLLQKSPFTLPGLGGTAGSQDGSGKTIPAQQPITTSQQAATSTIDTTRQASGAASTIDEIVGEFS